MASLFPVGRIICRENGQLMQQGPIYPHLAASTFQNQGNHYFQGLNLVLSPLSITNDYLGIKDLREQGTGAQLGSTGSDQVGSANLILQYPSGFNRVSQMVPSTPAWKHLISHTFSSHEVIPLIEATLMSKHEVKIICGLHKDEVQAFIDVVYKVCPHSSPGHILILPNL